MFMRALVRNDRTKEKARSADRTRLIVSDALEVEPHARAELARRCRIALLAAGVTEQRQFSVEVVLVRQVQAIDGELPLGGRNVPGDPSVQHAISRLASVLVIHDARDGTCRRCRVPSSTLACAASTAFRRGSTDRRSCQAR